MNLSILPQSSLAQPGTVLPLGQAEIRDRPEIPQPQPPRQSGLGALTAGVAGTFLGGCYVPHEGYQKLVSTPGGYHVKETFSGVGDHIMARLADPAFLLPIATVLVFLGMMRLEGTRESQLQQNLPPDNVSAIKSNDIDAAANVVVPTLMMSAFSAIFAFGTSPQGEKFYNPAILDAGLLISFAMVAAILLRRKL